MPDEEALLAEFADSIIYSSFFINFGTVETESAVKENAWSIGGTKRGRRNRAKALAQQQNQPTPKANEDIDMTSQESSPTNETKAPKLSSLKSKLQDSYPHWKTQQIGNEHISSEKLFQFLSSGCENVNLITSETGKYSNNPSLLRKQLEALISKVDDKDLKGFIKEACEAIPITIPSVTQ